MTLGSWHDVQVTFSPVEGRLTTKPQLMLTNMSSRPRGGAVPKVSSGGLKLAAAGSLSFSLREIGVAVIHRADF